MKRTPKFKTEADLCAAFLAWLKRTAPGVAAYPEWAGWDILLVLPSGCQMGVQAKLRLNADVIGQALPSRWGWGEDNGPDYRAVLVPDAGGSIHALASHLEVVVFEAQEDYDFKKRENLWRFSPGFADGSHEPWFDWNPPERHSVPETPTDSIAGSSAPVTLTPWKIRALAVLAELAVKGTITAKGMRELGVSPGRWMTYRWLEPAEPRGHWKRGDACPKFELQHPSAYAAALEKARAPRAVA